MATVFNDRISEAWKSSQWIIDEMFDHGMCFMEGYLPSIDLTLLETNLERLSDLSSSFDLSRSTWSDSASESDWNQTYQRHEYVSFFQSKRIIMLHFDYLMRCAEYEFVIKLMIEPEANLEVIIYRENFLPRNETQDRFFAACYHLKYLHELFHAPALFLGPDTLSYPQWPDVVPDEWQRLL